MHFQTDNQKYFYRLLSLPPMYALDQDFYKNSIFWIISVEAVVAAAAKLEVCDDDDGGVVAVYIQDRSSIGEKTPRYGFTPYNIRETFFGSTFY